MNVDGLAGEDVGHVFVLPQRRLAAGHVADAADAVDDGLSWPWLGSHLEELGFALPVGQSPIGLLVADPDRIRRVEPTTRRFST